MVQLFLLTRQDDRSAKTITEHSDVNGPPRRRRRPLAGIFGVKCSSIHSVVLIPSQPLSRLLFAAVLTTSFFRVSTYLARRPKAVLQVFLNRGCSKILFATTYSLMAQSSIGL